MKTIKDVAGQIKFNYAMSELIKKMIMIDKDEESRLELIKYLVHFDINHFTGRYSDEWIERELIQYGSKIRFKHTVSAKRNSVLHVMTGAYSIGGHTTIVNNWIDYDETREYTVVFTNMRPKGVPQFFRETAKRTGTKLIFLNEKDTIRKARELLKLSDEYERIVLHTNMFDVIPIIAYSNKNWKRPVYFYNHANFLFSLGMSISDCVLCLCEYDKIKAKRYRGATKAYVLPMPMKTVVGVPLVVAEEEGIFDNQKIKSEIRMKYKIKPDSKIIISMGADYKYKKIIGYDFAEFVKKLMAETENTYFFIIGANTENVRWKKLSEETGNRAHALGVLERDEVTKWMQIADIYVASFPMVAGGRAEAIENNIPTFSLKMTNRTSAYFDDTCCESILELISCIKDELNNRGKYKSTISILKDGEDEKTFWKNQLQLIWDHTLEHETHSFVSNMIISKEEIINTQLEPKEERYPYINSSTLNRPILKIIQAIYKINLRNGDG